MCKKIAVYLMVFYIAFFPVQRANAVVPIVAGAVYAIELAAPHAIRFLASEIAISAVVKAVQVSNAYYSAGAKISKLKYLKYFKSKVALGAAAFTAVVGSLGYFVSKDGEIMKQGALEYPENVPPPVAGIFWEIDGKYEADTAQASADLFCSDVGEPYCSKAIVELYVYDKASEDFRTSSMINVGGNEWTTRVIRRSSCKYADSDVVTCHEGYVPPSGLPTHVDDAVLLSSLMNHISTLDQQKQRELLADDSGVIDSALAKEFEAENAPLMPDEKTPIPDIGDQSWTNAHLIASGKAQSSDSLKPNYVSTADWDEGYYLANTVANGNSQITGLNSGVISPSKPGDNTGEGAGSGNVSVTVDVAGVESRLDTTNQLSESILNEVKSINSSTVDLQQMPDESKAKSFWPKRYPDGLSGVLSKFIEDMKQTPIFKWLDQFVLNIGSGTAPVYEFCFGTIANIDFGCLELKADSYVWVGIRSALIISALLMARRLVFGG